MSGRWGLRERLWSSSLQGKRKEGPHKTPLYQHPSPEAQGRAQPWLRP